MKTIILFLLSTIAVYAYKPQNNPYCELYDTCPAWTNEIIWDNAVDVHQFGTATYWDDIVEQAMTEISNNGGGVLYFPAGTYLFKQDLILKDGVVLRGNNPLNSDAKSDLFAPPSRLIFPKYEPEFVDEGTPNSTAFKVISGQGISNAGLVNLDINRARISIGYNGNISSKNILLLGVRQNNVAEPQSDIPNSYPHMHKWQRFSFRMTRNIAISVKENGAIVNCRVNDFEKNQLHPITNDGYLQQGAIVYGKFSDFVGGDLSKPIWGTNNGSDPDDTTHIIYGEQYPFSYTDHYGISLYGSFINPDTVSKNYNQKIEIIDNWVYNTMRVGIFGVGYGLVIKGNIREDDSLKRVFMHPIGWKINANNSATYENRGLNFSGQKVYIENNILKTYRHRLRYCQYMSVDGEGILIQTQDSYGDVMKDLFIRNNTLNTYMGIYDVKVVMKNIHITGNNMMNLANIMIFKKEVDYPADNIYIENNNNVKGLSIGYKVSNSQYAMNGNNIFIRNNSGSGGLNHPCQAVLGNNIGFTYPMTTCTGAINEKIIISPYKEETMVGANAEIYADFLEPIIAGSMSGVTLNGSTSGTIGGVSFQIEGNKLKITHNAFANPSELITVTIPAGVVMSQSGAVSNAELTWTFTTAYKPYPIFVFPSDSTKGVKQNENMVAYFDQEVNVIDLSGITIKDQNNNTVIDVVSNLGTDKRTLTIKHADLPLSDHYYSIHIPANSVRNTSGYNNDVFRWTVKTRGNLLYVSAKDIKPEMKLKIYPNPTSTHLTIESYENSSISIFSIDGRLLMNKKMETGIENIDVQFLLRGMYLLKIENKQTQNTIKFIKK